MLSKIKNMNSTDLELLCKEIEYRLKNEKFDDFIKGSLESLLDYGKLTIQNRAFPKVEDGLKPVHRRILYGMKDLNLTATSPYKKSARICGHIVGTLHPHGDCLSGDTKILVDNKILTLEEMYKKQGEFNVYSKGSKEVLYDVRIGQYTNEIYHIHLSNGGIIRATSNHPIFIKGKGWVKAEDLKESMILESFFKSEDSNQNDILKKINKSMIKNLEKVFHKKLTWEEYEKEPKVKHVAIGMIKTLYKNPKEFISKHLKEDFIYIDKIHLKKVNKVPMYDFSVKNKECVYIVVKSDENSNTMVLVHNSSVYDAMVRMAQDFSMREVLIEGQGNFGTIEGDSQAAARYTEATVSKTGESFFKDLEKNVVDFQDNYDETTTEPSVLPVKFPNLIINGTLGIAVGMVSKIPPHNPKETIEACKYIVNQRKNKLEIDIDELARLIPAPDFPTGGICYNGNMKEVLTTGSGRFKLRAKYKIEKNKNKESIVITEIPYQFKLSTVFSVLQEVSNNKKKDPANEFFEKSISNLRNESGKDGLRIVIDLKTGVNSKILWNRILKVCSLDETVTYVNNVIDIDGMPKLMGVKDILESFINFRLEVLQRKYTFIKDEASGKLEIIEGYIKALSMIDKIISIIRNSDSEDEAIKTILSLGFSVRQTKAIVNLRLGRLTKLENLSLEKEKLNLEKIIMNAEKICKSNTLKYNEIISDLDESLNLFKDINRKTEIGFELEEEDLILHPKEEMVFYYSNIGYLKTELLKKDKGFELSENDFVAKRIESSSLDDIYFICESGMVFAKKIHDIERCHINSIIGKEKIVDIIIGEGLFIFGTKKGFVKKSKSADYAGAFRNSGVIGIKLKEDDAVIFASLEKEFISLFSKEGKCIKFESSLVPIVGRASQGVVGIKGEVIKGTTEENEISLISQNGIEVKVDISKLNVQGRAGKGVYFKKVDKKTGEWLK